MRNKRISRIVSRVKDETQRKLLEKQIELADLQIAQHKVPWWKKNVLRLATIVTSILNAVVAVAVPYVMPVLTPRLPRRSEAVVVQQANDEVRQLHDAIEKSMNPAPTEAPIFDEGGRPIKLVSSKSEPAKLGRSTQTPSGESADISGE